jgi:D-psicose/D-tagatose/L-ribulose 3-epimerase
MIDPGFAGWGAHASLWVPEWTRAGAEQAVAAAAAERHDFIEIPLLDPDAVDAAHTRDLLQDHALAAVCSLGLPKGCWPSEDAEAAQRFLTNALDRTAALGASALTGVTYGGIGQITGQPPTDRELDASARLLDAGAKHARRLGLSLGVEAPNRYENHLINAAHQADAMVRRVGADNVFVHLDSYHMNIEESGLANGVLAARETLGYLHLSESHRGVPGTGACDWDALFAALSAIGYRGPLGLESFVHLPPAIASALAVWRPVAPDARTVLREGFDHLKVKARQYGLVDAMG